MTEQTRLPRHLALLATILIVAMVASLSDDSGVATVRAAAGAVALGALVVLGAALLGHVRRTALPVALLLVGALAVAVGAPSVVRRFEAGVRVTQVELPPVTPPAA
jgi:hypothetical protein